LPAAPSEAAAAPEEFNARELELYKKYIKEKEQDV